MPAPPGISTPPRPCSGKPRRNTGSSWSRRKRPTWCRSSASTRTRCAGAEPPTARPANISPARRRRMTGPVTAIPGRTMTAPSASGCRPGRSTSCRTARMPASSCPSRCPTRHRAERPSASSPPISDPRTETMGILNIAPAERAGAHLLIQLYGPPRSGKTYTALRIARGMVGPQGRIGMLDTESGRARLYSDKVPGGFVVGELTPPYTPSRYLEAIEEFLRYGVDILVEGTGAKIAEWVGAKPVDHALELLRRAAFDAAAAGTQAFAKWWNSAPVRGRRKALRPDLDNLASIARAADQEIARERQAEEAARQQQLDQALLADPFGKPASPGNGAVERALPLKSVGDGRHPLSGARA